MEQNLDLDLKTYDLIRSYDKLISKKENELQNCFFDNLKPEDKTGDIELPLIYKEDSDYAKLKRIKQDIVSQIARFEKKINFPEKYIIKDVLDNLTKTDLTKEEREVLINKGMELEIKKAKTAKEKLELRLKTIEEDPISSLRFDELDRSDFSAIKDKEVLVKLNKIKMEIDDYTAKRNAIMATLKETEENIPKM